MKRSTSSPGQRFAPITNDKVFKLILTEESNKPILIELLNVLIPDKHIVNLKYLDKERHGFVFQDKTTIFDVYCESDAGERFVVEMQAHGQKFFADRMLVYATYPIREQIVSRFGSPVRQLVGRLVRRKQQVDYSLLPVYMVSITNFVLPHETAVLEDGLVSRYSIRDDYEGEQLTNALHFVFFELGRLPYKVGEESKCETRLQKIACAMRYMQEYKEVPQALREEILVNQLFEAFTLANMTVKQRKYFDKNVMETWIDKYAQIDYAREEGSAQRSVEIARAMLADGINPSIVSKYTGLSPEEIAALKDHQSSDGDERV